MQTVAQTRSECPSSAECSGRWLSESCYTCRDIASDKLTSDSYQANNVACWQVITALWPC